MNIEYAKPAKKALERMEVSVRQRIRAAINKIPDGDIVPMQGFSDGRQRLRIGKYRVVFLLSGEDLEVINIGSRGDIYK